jgi:alpha-L-fucosidase
MKTALCSERRTQTFAWLSVFILCTLMPGNMSAQESHRNMAIVHPDESIESIVAKAANVVPSPRQMAWQEREFEAFIHFGVNTFTDREWGEGTESPSVFNPTALDARQWARVARDAGMKLIIVVAKHHDGFCMWPSKFTEHSVKNSPWRGGKGDVVGEVAAACREFGLKLGVYLSPWDRHERCYGDSPRYNEHFRNQLRELLTNYGPVDEVWFDGACGEGPNGKRQVYDWQSYYALIRELAPAAVISIMGPDVRWVGTESGVGRETEWSVVPDISRNVDSIAARSQQNPVDGGFNPGDLMQADLGSREKIRTARTLVWYPAQTNTSNRPGWFYHQREDTLVKSPQTLVDTYFSAVGRNGQFLLNIPPDRRGLIHENDVKNLLGMRRILDSTFAVNLCANAKVKATSARKGYAAANATDRSNATWWMPAEGAVAPSLEWTFPAEITFDCLLLQERITVGQRIEKFRLQAWSGSAWKEIVQGTTVGYKRLLRFPAVTANRVRLVIDEARTSPTLSTVGLFKTP